MKESIKNYQVKNLPKPECPQAVNGVIDLNVLTGYVIVRVYTLYNFNPGDELTVFFGDIIPHKQFLPYVYPLPPYTDILYYKNEFNNGNYQVWYNAKDSFGNISEPSDKLYITIKGAEQPVQPELPAPEFPDSINNILYYDTVANKKGTPIRASYSEIEEGQGVVFYWWGIDADGNHIVGSEFSTAKTVSDDDADKKYIEAFIPAEYIFVLGDKGRGQGQYDVYPEGLDTGYSWRSAIKDVELLKTMAYTLQLILTTGAVYADENYPHLTPCNYVIVYGQPGTEYRAFVSNGAVIIESYGGGGPYTFSLDQSGKAIFRVLQHYSAALRDVVTVTVYPSANPTASVTKSMLFLPYWVGQGKIRSYGYTTGAISGTEVPCSVYIIAEKGSSAIRVVVSGNALINGYAAELTVPLYDDGTTSFDIYDKSAETVSVWMQEINDPSQPIRFSVDFIPSPI